MADLEPQFQPDVPFQPDVLGAPYLSKPLHLADDDEGEVVAHLVRRGSGDGSRPAVLHVHGFADYFFQVDYAAWWDAHGYDFYALDLRKYGRSLLPHQTANFITDVREYDEELDLAWSEISSRHSEVILSAHSTGGLILPLWAHRRRHPEVTGMVLNSPWFDLRGPLWMRTLGTKVVDQVGARIPKRVIPRDVSGLYARALHHEHEGEWEFSLDWKPLSSWPVYTGWLRAIRRAHAELHRGIDLPFPVLVLCSDRTGSPTEMGDEVMSTDIVLDVRADPALGAVPGLPAARARRDRGCDARRHALPRAVRKQVYTEIETFLHGYVEPLTSDHGPSHRTRPRPHRDRPRRRRQAGQPACAHSASTPPTSPTCATPPGSPAPATSRSVRPRCWPRAALARRCWASGWPSTPATPTRATSS